MKLFSVKSEFPIREHPFEEVWNVFVGRRYRFAGYVEVNSRLRFVPEFTAKGIVTWLHFPFGAMNPIPCGGMLTGVWAIIVSVVEKKLVWKAVEV